MQINTHTITITDDEKDTIGMALELYLQEEMKLKWAFKTFEKINKEEINLLQQFVYMGHILTITKESDDIFDIRNTTDVQEWLENEWNKTQKGVNPPDESQNVLKGN